MEKILTAYYGCSGLSQTRTVNCLTISSNSKTKELVFDARSSSTSALHPTSDLKLQFNWAKYEAAGDAFLLFPLEHVHTFAAVGLGLDEDEWRSVLQKMKGLLHLRLENTDASTLLDVLDVGGEGMYGKATK